MFAWQAILVAVIVLAAAVYLAREIWRAVFAKEGGSCGSCGSCGAEDSAKAKPLVSLDDRPTPRQPK